MPVLTGGLSGSAQSKVRHEYQPFTGKLGFEKVTNCCADCLTKNNYNDAKCQDVVKALYECCEAFYSKYGEDATTPSCPKPNLLKLKMKQLAEGR